MTSKLYVAWQDSSRRWHTVGQLSRLNGKYEFVFTEGARPYEALLKSLFQVSPGEKYEFQQLIPLFKNRLLSNQRPDAKKLLAWVGGEPSFDEFELLAKYGAIPGTDSIMLYPEATIFDNKYSVEFFIHGMRYMHADVKGWSSLVEEGTQLLPMLDLQNEADSNAIALRSCGGNLIVGYVPAFHAVVLAPFLRNLVKWKEYSFKVVRKNIDAPDQLKLLCRFEMEFPSTTLLPTNDEAKPYLKQSRQFFLAPDVRTELSAKVKNVKF